MPYKSKEDQREKRQEEVIRIKQNRVIEGYVFHNHPEIYKKAKALYTTLDALYPGKYDLRRTQEYQQAIGKGTGKDKYKYLKRCTATRQNQDETVQATNTPVVPTNTPVVPANSPVVTANTPVVPTNTPVVPTNSPVVPANTPVVTANSPVVPANTPVVTANSPVVPVIPYEETVQATNSPVVPVIPYEETVQATNSPVVPANTPDTLPLLPDEVINNIVKELMQEPSIDTFFKNFDTGFQDTLYDPIDMEINEGLTPLEKELTKYT